MQKDWLEELIAATNTDKRNERQMRILEAAVDMLEKKDTLQLQQVKCKACWCSGRNHLPLL